MADKTYGTFSKKGKTRTAYTPEQAVRFRFDGWVELDETRASTVPPRGGTGSGVADWAAYAQANGVEVAEGTSRDDIIAALDAAGIATVATSDAGGADSNPSGEQTS